MAWASARAGAPAAALRRPDPSGPARPTFLLIHGVGLSHLAFSRLARALVDHGTVLAPDLPGFGRAPGARRRVSVEEMAEALLPALDRGGIGPRSLVVLGHSLGAQVAIEVARLRPDLVRGVVLIGPVVDRRAASAVGQARRLLLDMVLEPPVTGAMVARDYVRGGLLSFAAGVRSMLRYPTAERLPAVTAPLLVLRGSGDPVAPARWDAELARLVVDGRTAEVAGAVHNVPHSHPTEVARHVLAFAASLVDG
ncbi:alpha/beta fold hydrolase [Clavibacter capsici]|uniref:alpha/beta fold hydrolase n=1 Tax=Clavibacter capsici TaxID=1874630 RepID=UPI0014281F47|nr:alpha/beta fold hydrolase [Clavibacter capsici]QIS38473.1 alpha/beta hydrolase [Clavibacter capsici]